jgi:hypothetical protein
MISCTELVKTILPTAFETPGTGPEELAHRRSRRKKSTCQVDIDDGLPVCEGHILDGGRSLNTGIGHKDVQCAEAVHGLGHHCPDLIFTRDIGFDRDCLAARCLNFADNGRSLFPRPCSRRMVHNYDGAQPCEFHRRCPTQSRGRSSNDGHLPGKARWFHVMLLGCSSACRLGE